MRAGISTALTLAILLAAAPLAGQLAGFPSTAETRAEFEGVCRRMREGANEYFGQAIVGDLDRRLEEARGDPLVESLLRLRLGNELIRLGRLPEAITHLERALALAEAPPLATDGDVRLRVLWYLGLAHLQLAEDQNCVARHTAASCILPITADGVHTLPSAARTAGDNFLRFLEGRPDDAQGRWLLSLARMVSGDYPEKVPPTLRLPEGALAGDGAFPRWRDLAPELGVNAFDLSGGAILDDFDGDGRLDLISSSWDPCEPLKAFRNDGRGGFEDVAAAWGLDAQLGGLNVVHADFDGDGMLDLLVLRGAWLGDEGRIRKSLLRNDLRRTDGRFVDVTAAAGLAYPAYPTQTAAWADYDADGDLDLYVGNEATGSSTDPLALFGESGNPYPSQLFRNEDDGTFADVTRRAGVDNRRFAKGVTWGDYDDDGDPDLYISNLGPNRLYRNEGDGAFTDVTDEAGVREPSKGTFPTWFFDYDNDGDLDLFVGGFNAPVAAVTRSYLGERSTEGRPALYRNDGGRFTDVSLEVGLDRPLLVMGANFGDLDNDGWLDLYLGTGVPAYEALMPNVMYRNDGGRRFLDVTFAGGFGHLQKGHGVAFGDLDGDGQQEIFQQLGGAFPYDAYGNALYAGPPSGNAWIVLRLVARGANRFGVGARLEVRVATPGGSRSVHALAGGGGSFGGSSLQQEIGLGDARAVEWLAVQWPGGGGRQVFREVPLNGYYEVREGASELVALDAPRVPLGAAARAPRHHPDGSR